jgi:opacity protein-like surface antigen
MQKTILIGTLFVAAVAASAQEAGETPKLEVGAEYTYVRVNPGGDLSSYNSNGGSAFAEYNINKYFGVVADLGATRVGTTNGFSLNNTTFEYLFGPRVNFRHSRFTPYIQALVGGERLTNGFNPGSPAAQTGVSQNNFAAEIGGGLDITLTNHIAIKPIEVDYLLAQVSPSGTNLNYVQNNLRYSAGVVFRFGSK